LNPIIIIHIKKSGLLAHEVLEYDDVQSAKVGPFLPVAPQLVNV